MVVVVVVVGDVVVVVVVAGVVVVVVVLPGVVVVVVVVVGVVVVVVVVPGVVVVVVVVVGVVVVVVVAVGVVVVVEVVVVVVVPPPAHAFASQQLDCVPTWAVPPWGAVQLLALLTTLHEVMPPASVRQQVTNPGFPHVELDAQFMIASTQSLESVPALTASLVA